MTPDIANYADYYLRRLVHSLEKPYDPDRDGVSGLVRLTARLVGDTETLPAKDLKELRDGSLDEDELARLVLRLADQIVASPKFHDLELDINIVRALLYLERKDPRIDQRVRQYLFGRQLTPLAHQAVAALDPNTGEDRAFEIITALGTLMWTVERAALVFSIDQVEDLRFFDDAEERFQRAARDLIQIANRLPNAIIIISCLEDFYGQVRGVLAQSYVDRIEKAGPVALHESRTPQEARLIIARRLEHIAEVKGGGLSFPDPAQFFGPDFFEEFGGLSTRRLLEHAQTRLREKARPEPEDGALSFLDVDAGVRARRHFRRRRDGSGTRRRGCRLSRRLGALPERVRGRDPLRRERDARRLRFRALAGEARMGRRGHACRRASRDRRRCARRSIFTSATSRAR